MDLFSRARHLQFKTYTVPRDFIAVVEGALYCPYNNVILSKAGMVVAESLNVVINGLDVTKLRNREVVTLTGTHALLRSRANNYYHTIVDNLPRVLALERATFSDFGEIRLLCPGGATELEAFFLTQFDLPNVRALPLEQGVLYEMERLIFTPYKSKLFSGYLPDWYVQKFRSKVFPDRPTKRNRRIFISREHALRQERKIVNEGEVRSLLSNLGFEVQCPELLSYSDQIELFYDAEMVVGVHGAGLTNALYAPPELKVVEIFASDKINPAYYFLSKSLGHAYSWVCGDGEGLFPPQFAIDPRKLVKALDQLLISEN